MSSGLLYRTLQDPTTVTAVCSVQSQDGDVVLQLQDTQLTCWRVGHDGLENITTWRAPASMLQMVQLPGNSLLLFAEAGRCFLHRWDKQHAAFGAAAPALEAQAQLQVPIDSTSSQVQPFGCVVSRNVLSAPSGSGFASLAAVVYSSGVLHVIKAAPVLANSQEAQEPSSNTAAAAAGAAEGHMQLQTKAMALTPALLSCHAQGGYCSLRLTQSITRWQGHSCSLAIPPPHGACGHNWGTHSACASSAFTARFMAAKALCTHTSQCLPCTQQPQSMYPWTPQQPGCACIACMVTLQVVTRLLLRQFVWPVGC
jgi:hypothetical protein